MLVFTYPERKQLTLRELRYLIALADHFHFGRAANACHVTQSTLSIQLRKLESYLGHTLVNRQGQRPTMTPIGEQIVVRARRLIQEADDILSLTRVPFGSMRGTLTLGVIPTLAPYYLPDLFAVIREAFPELRLVVHEGLTSNLCMRLDEGSIDVALLALPTPLSGLTHSVQCKQCEVAVQALPAPLQMSAYELRVLFDEPFYVALQAGHPLSDKDSVSVNDLAGEELLLLTEGHCLRGQALEICQQREAHADDTLDCRATSLETLLHLVAAGHGCTLLPALATKSVDLERLTIQPLAERAFRRIGLVWQSGHPRDRGMELFANALREAIPEKTKPYFECMQMNA